LLAAHQKLSACALCSAERIRINRALGQPLRDSEYLLDEALLADPGAPSAVFQYFAHLYPQWGGSFEQMRAFIDHIQSRVNDPAILAELESRFCWEQARAAESRRDNKSAFAWYERGVTAHPYDMLMKNLAEAYTERGEYRKAVDILERNLQVNDPWDLYTIEALAQAYFRSDQQKQGEAMMQKRDEAQERYNHFR
jgi:tetratricopeptide (TPR) repeat protein